VILKGAGTVVARGDRRVLVVPTGGPALSSGGTGDVLTGIVSALLAAGLDAFEAAGLGAWWHGETADRLPQAEPGFGLLASELADAFPATARALRAACGAAERAIERRGEEGEDGRGRSVGLQLRFPGP
jgi:NAD(P)H-hydrate repair Nnr-like enzyme with NAD(P)H-hydrate dehydratase domain